MIEMSEKEPGSLEHKGSFKCQGSTPNILRHFRDSLGCCGLMENYRGTIRKVPGLLDLIIIKWCFNTSSIVLLTAQDYPLT